MSRKQKYRPVSYYYKLLSNKPDFLSVTEAARLLSLCTKTLYQMVNTKQITAMQIGRKYLFPRQSILEYIRQHQPPERIEKGIYAYPLTSQEKEALTRADICKLLHVSERTVSMNKADFPFRSVKMNIRYLYPLQWFIEDLQSLFTREV